MSIVYVTAALLNERMPQWRLCMSRCESPPAHYSCTLTQGCRNGYVSFVIECFCPYLSQLTSQHPYTQQHIGPPHVYTINMADLPQVEKVVNEIFARQVWNLCMFILIVLYVVLRMCTYSPNHAYVTCPSAVTLALGSLQARTYLMNSQWKACCSESWFTWSTR